jgi:hypothetical protein
MSRKMSSTACVTMRSILVTDHGITLFVRANEPTANRPPSKNAGDNNWIALTPAALAAITSRSPERQHTGDDIGENLEDLDNAQTAFGSFSKQTEKDEHHSEDDHDQREDPHEFAKDVSLKQFQASNPFDTRSGRVFDRAKRSNVRVFQGGFPGQGTGIATDPVDSRRLSAKRPLKSQQQQRIRLKHAGFFGGPSIDDFGLPAAERGDTCFQVRQARILGSAGCFSPPESLQIRGKSIVAHV